MDMMESGRLYQDRIAFGKSEKFICVLHKAAITMYGPVRGSWHRLPTMPTGFRPSVDISRFVWWRRQLVIIGLKLELVEFPETVNVEEAIVTIRHCTEYGIPVWKQCLPEKGTSPELAKLNHEIFIGILNALDFIVVECVEERDSPPTGTNKGFLVWEDGGGSRSVAREEDESNTSQHDISIDSISVSTQGKELLKNASVKISRGKRSELPGTGG
ncbi:hypothetical protein SUGI_0669680 [Cryptomeria japonica]|nr:hypothetical protein SUGI_0669680 [Cryptomeria japonica]